MSDVLLGENVQFVAVEPGSQDDPFTARGATPSAPAAASPAVQHTGQVVTPTEEGKAQPAPPAATQVASQASPEATGTEPTPEPLSPLQQAIKDGTVDEYVAGLVAKSVEPVRRDLQSSADRRIAALEKELRDAREAEKQRERDGKLANPDLTDEEKAILREKWELDDAKEQLAADINVADAYYRTMYIAGLVQEAGKFGVTAEQLEQFEEPEQMDAFVTTQELEFYKSGKHLTAQVPANAVVANPTGSAPAANTAPAGASAPSDIGGGAPAAPAVELEKGTGLDVMARNMNKSAWESVPLPN